MNKKTLVLLTLALMFFGFSPNYINAQAAPGQTVISVGAGYSLKYGSTIPDDYDYILNDYNASPVYTGSVDFASVKRLSMGIAASYQTISLASASNYETYTDSLIIFPTAVTSLNEDLTILNVGLRVHVHFMPDVEKVDLYAGGRAGFNFYNYTSNIEEVDQFAYYEEILKKDYNLPSFQFGFGMRYYATQNVGLNLEGMIGNGPYMILLGLNFKFGGEGV